MSCFTFRFLYSDGTEYRAENINCVIIDTPVGVSRIQGDDILSAKFSVPFESMRLSGPDKNVMVSGNNAIVVEASRMEK